MERVICDMTSIRGNTIRKVGDTVRIQNAEDMDFVSRGVHGYIMPPAGYKYIMTAKMQELAGMTARITELCKKAYHLDLGKSSRFWEEWMFDPDYVHDDNKKPLLVDEAITAMVRDNKTLHDGHGLACQWREDHFIAVDARGKTYMLTEFDELYDDAGGQKRLWTMAEFIRWVRSPESAEYVVRWISRNGYTDWTFPQNISFNSCKKLDNHEYAKILPDGSGADMETIRRFEKEEI
jgi:hypothetical protein